MRKRIAITALSALFAAGSLFGALAKPALADNDDHHVRHHHAYQHNGTRSGWNEGNHTGWYNGKYYGNGTPTAATTGTWVNGKYYPHGYTGGAWNANGNWNHRSTRGDRDDRKVHHHKDTDARR